MRSKKKIESYISQIRRTNLHTHKLRQHCSYKTRNEQAYCYSTSWTTKTLAIATAAVIVKVTFDVELNAYRSKFQKAHVLLKLIPFACIDQRQSIHIRKHNEQQIQPIKTSFLKWFRDFRLDQFRQARVHHAENGTYDQAEYSPMIMQIMVFMINVLMSFVIIKRLKGRWKKIHKVCSVITCTSLTNTVVLTKYLHINLVLAWY